MKATAILEGKIQPFVSRCANTPTGKKIINAYNKADDYIGDKMIKAVNSPTYERFCKGVGECVTDISQGLKEAKLQCQEQFPKATATIKDFFSNIFPS